MPWFCGGSTINELREDEQRLVVVVFGVVFVLVVGVSRVRRLLVCCWLGCRSRDDRGRGSCWLFEPAVYNIVFPSIPFQTVFRRSEPGHVAREVTVVSVGSAWL